MQLLSLSQKAGEILTNSVLLQLLPKHDEVNFLKIFSVDERGGAEKNDKVSHIYRSKSHLKISQIKRKLFVLFIREGAEDEA